MPELTNAPRSDETTDVLRDDWLARLSELTQAVKTWAEHSGWKTREITKSMKDSVLGAYRAPALLMQRETVEVILNPVSRFVPGADGAVDLYLMPGYDDVASLYFIHGEWRLHYVFRAEPKAAALPEPEIMSLSESTVMRVLDELVAHAASPFRLARSHQGR